MKATSVFIMMTNEVFIMELCEHPRQKETNLYYFELKPLTEAHQHHLDLLGDSLAMICNNKSGKKSSIVLDCSALTNSGLIQRFLKLSFKKALAIDNPMGLDKFMIITASVLVKVISNSIIKIKNAAHYTKVCASREEALSNL